MTIRGVILGWFAGAAWFVSGAGLVCWSALAAVRPELAFPVVIVGLGSMTFGVLVTAAPVRPVLALSAVLAAIVGGVPVVLAALRADPLTWLVCIGYAAAAALSGGGRAATRAPALVPKRAPTRAGVLD